MSGKGISIGRVVLPGRWQLPIWRAWVGGHEHESYSRRPPCAGTTRLTGRQGRLGPRVPVWRPHTHTHTHTHAHPGLNGHMCPQRGAPTHAHAHVPPVTPPPFLTAGDSPRTLGPACCYSPWDPGQTWFLGSPSCCMENGPGDPGCSCGWALEEGGGHWKPDGRWIWPWSPMTA